MKWPVLVLALVLVRGSPRRNTGRPISGGGGQT